MVWKKRPKGPVGGVAVTYGYRFRCCYLYSNRNYHDHSCLALSLSLSSGFTEISMLGSVSGTCM